MRLIDEVTQKALSGAELGPELGLDNSHSLHRNFRFMEAASANDVF